jgi:hypothetical protein
VNGYPLSTIHCRRGVLKEILSDAVKNVLGDSGSRILEDPYYLNIEKRILKISIIIGLGMLLGSYFWISGKFALSFLLGGAISLINFSWMKQGVDRIFQGFQPESPAPRRSNQRIIFKYFIRYALIGGTLYVIFRNQFFEVRAAFWGLFLVVIAVLYECLHQVIKSLIEDWKRGRA